MTPFLEAQFIRYDHMNRFDHWRDISTETHYVWESMFGTIRLRKRANYPQCFAFMKGKILFCGYGDLSKAQKIAGKPLHEVEESAFYDDEFLLIAANCQEQTVVVQRDAFGTISLFAGQTANHLVLSSSFEKVCTSLPRGSLHIDRLNLVESIFMLGQRSNTLFKEVRVLYDRARLVWHNKYQIIEPPDAQAILYAQQNRTADAKLFVPFLEETLDKYARRYGQTAPFACDLSGGYDSSLLAGYYTDRQLQVVTGTLLYPGEFGVSVHQKLQAFLQRFPVLNTAIAMHPESEYPLVEMAAHNQWRPFYPRKTLYSASIGKVADSYVRQGADTVFTGIGGDELCQNIHPAAALEQGPSEYKRRMKLPLPSYAQAGLREYLHAALGDMSIQHKVVPVMAYSVVQQNVCAYDVYIDRGLWPVAPLADPRLFMYCQSLPIRYRTQKNILKSYLYARKFPPVLYGAGAKKEHFGQFFDLAVARGLKEPMRMFFESSVLAQEGLIDKSVLIRLLDSSPLDNIWIDLYTLFSLEVTMQTLGIKSIN